MRRFLALVACVASVAFLAGPAAATIGPPVEVRMASGGYEVLAGQRYEGRLEFAGMGRLTIANIAVGGAGWRLLAADHPAPVTLEKGQSQFVSFTAVAEDPRQPLEVTFEADGVPVTRLLDLSGETLRLGRPVTVAHVVEAPTPGLALTSRFTSVAPSPDIEPSRVDREPGQEHAEPEGARATTSVIYTHGRLVYTRPDGVTVGADGLTVRVWDANTGGDVQLAVTATDAFGFFALNVTWPTCGGCEALPDLYVTFETSNNTVDVKNPATNQTYLYNTNTYWNFIASDLNVGTLSTLDQAVLPPLHQMTMYTRVWRWLSDSTATAMPKLHVRWPDPSGPVCDGPTIYLPTAPNPQDGRGWHTEDVVHEYGHFWHYTFGVDAGGQYCNGICDSPSCGHCTWCPESPAVAWNEGWSDWFSDKVPRWFAARYGDAPYWPPNHENLGVCTSATVDAEKTEGNFANLLRDIEDGTQDDEPGDIWRDRLSEDVNRIFATSRLDAPVGPLDFVRKFWARYPAMSKPNLWEAAADDKFDELDLLAPDPPTNLHSTSHTVGGSSPDPTIDFQWTFATDDWSGASGYSVSVTASPSLPDAGQDIANQNFYTTVPLPPGTYYFNIRTRDRANHWSATAASVGPFTIQAASPQNVTWTTPAGWARPAVPRPAANATSGSVPNPASLIGDSTVTYANIAGINTGGQPTTSAFFYRAHIDGLFDGAGFISGVLNGGQVVKGLNGGPFSVRGGRHTFGLRMDDLEALSETNESDNEWAHQWVWSPPSIPANTTIHRAAPPQKDGGWDTIVDGSAFNYDVDGLRVSTLTGFWSVVSLEADDDANDYDLRLYFPSSSPDTGFFTPRASSSRLQGQLDAVIVNRNVVTTPTNWDIGVIDWQGASNYTLRQSTSSTMPLGSSLALTMAADEHAMVREFFAPSATQPITIRVDHAASDGPLTVLWLTSSYQAGGLSNYNASSVTDPTTGTAVIEFAPGETGWHGVIVYRDPEGSSGQPLSYTLTVEPTKPDPMTASLLGWYAPLVPRPAPDGASLYAPEPTSLVGDATETWLNLALRENSLAPLAGAHTQVDLDGQPHATFDFGAVAAYSTTPLNDAVPRFVPGGRHALTWTIDPLDQIAESDEYNNVSGEQWIWTPPTIGFGSLSNRPVPPDPIGGWGSITDANTGLWYNEDGVRTPVFAPGMNQDGRWGAVAIMPNGGDADLRLHSIATGVHDGFGPVLVSSDWGADVSDFTLANFKYLPYEAFDVGILRYSGTPLVAVDVVSSQYLGTPTGQAYGPFTMTTNELVHLYEVSLGPGGWAIDLDALAGAVDWGVSIHEPLPRLQSKSTPQDSAIAWLKPPGASETVKLAVQAPGDFAIAVWRAGSGDSRIEGTYQLRVHPAQLLAVDDAPPVRSSLTALAPNPTQSGARVSFDLAADGDVAVEVFDLRGARVRTLVSGRRPAGRYTVAWDGRSDTGSLAAHGLYLVRYRAPGHVGVRKLAVTR